MSVQNLDQLRAGNALRAAASQHFAGKGGGEIAKKIPMEIRTNGLLGSAAFAIDQASKGNKEEYQGRKDIFEKAILPHLHERWKEIPTGLVSALDHLTQADSRLLRVVTGETLAYLNYFRRFAKK